MEKCEELHKIHRNLIPIFILINEREKWINNDVKQFLSSNVTNVDQKPYFVSLVKTLKEITAKITSKITKLQAQYTIISGPFIINRIVR